MKSNIEYLKESLSSENEWIKAIEDELKAKDKIIADYSKEPHEDLDNTFNNVAAIVSIDCGIGVIEYIQPDNLKLQLLMEDFKEKQESVLFR